METPAENLESDLLRAEEILPDRMRFELNVEQWEALQAAVGGIAGCIVCATPAIAEACRAAQRAQRLRARQILSA